MSADGQVTPQTPDEAAALARVAERAVHALRAGGAEVVRHAAGGSATVAAVWFAADAAQDGEGRRATHRGDVHEKVRRKGRPALVRDYARQTTPAALGMALRGIRSAAAAPIVVDGRLWGSIGVSASEPDAFGREALEALAGFAADAARCLGEEPAPADPVSRLLGWRRRFGAIV